MASINATQLTLETIKDVDGGIVAKQFNALLAAAIHDCERRPGLDKARKLTLEVALTPLMSHEGHLEQVDVEFTMGQKVPGYTTGSQPMVVRHGDRLLFQPLSPDNPLQDPLPGIAGRIDKETGEVMDG